MAETDIDRLERVRARIAELRDARAEINNHPCPREKALTVLNRWIAAQAQLFQDELPARNLLTGNKPPRLAPLSFASGVHDWTPVLCAVAPDAIRQAFTARVDELLEGADEPLTDAERAERRQAIDAELANLERQEEALIQRLHQAGEPVTRRGDADPAAVLGLSEPPKAPEAEGRERYITTYRDSAGRQIVHHHRRGDGALGG